MRVTRTALTVAGVLLIAWGAGTIFTDGQSPAQLFNVGVWLAAMVIVHDGLWVPVVAVIRHRAVLISQNRTAHAQARTARTNVREP